MNSKNNKKTDVKILLSYDYIASTSLAPGDLFLICSREWEKWDLFISLLESLSYIKEIFLALCFSIEFSKAENLEKCYNYFFAFSIQSLTRLPMQKLY